MPEPTMLHVKNLAAVNYLGRYCYPTFSNFHRAVWKRKIRAYRVRYTILGFNESFGVAEVKVWKTLGYEWVRVKDIDFIWNYMEES